MKYYNKIPFWENIRRTKLLKKFREYIIHYLDNSEAHYTILDRAENDRAREIRSEINHMMDEIHEILTKANINPVIIYTPSPVTGGYVSNVDLIVNFFKLQRLRIPPRNIIDYLDRAIGVYEKDFIRSLLRTINPFYWISIILDYIVSLPFILIGKFGFNQQEIEASIFGKLFKIIGHLIIVIAALLTILEKTGYLNHFQRAVRTILNK